jgi:hypothetical protein
MDDKEELAEIEKRRESIKQDIEKKLKEASDLTKDPNYKPSPKRETFFPLKSTKKELKDV